MKKLSNRVSYYFGGGGGGKGVGSAMKNMTFSSGAIRDTQDGKEAYVETISWTAFKKYAEYMTSKKEKYGSGNFKKGITDASYEESLVRHVQKYLANKYENGVVERDEDHLSAIVFNAFGLLHNEEQRKIDSTYAQD